MLKLYLSNDVDTIFVNSFTKENSLILSSMKSATKVLRHDLVRTRYPSLISSRWIERLWFGLFVKFAVRFLGDLILREWEIHCKGSKTWSCMNRNPLQGSKTWSYVNMNSPSPILSWWIEQQLNLDLVWRIRHKGLWDLILYEHERSFTDFVGMDLMIIFSKLLDCFYSSLHLRIH